MANPRVCPYLYFYLEDVGSSLTKAWQAQQWLHELDLDLTTPMV